MFARWLDGFAVSIMVMDAEGKVLYMNDAADEVFKKFGGKNMVGSDISQCHKASSMITIKEMMENDSTNVYSIEKNGQKKIIYQAPWYEEGRVAGLVTMSLAVPEKIPHHERESS